MCFCQTLVASQKPVLANVKPVVTKVMGGYNVCIFAYGQTGSTLPTAIMLSEVSCKANVITWHGNVAHECMLPTLPCCQ